MNYIQDFLIYLTSQQVPMPSSWSSSLGLSINKNSQIETQEDISIQTQGFKLFRDKLLRGAVDHKLESAKSGKWLTYILQLWLIALRDIENKNGLPYLNLVYNIEKYITKTLLHVPIVSRENYSIYGDTRYPVKLTMSFTHTKEVLWTKTISTLSSNRPYVINSNLTDITGSQYDSIAEYLELEIETAPGIEVAVLNGLYSSLPTSLLSPTEGVWKAVSNVTVGEDTGSIALLPSLARTKGQISEKLLIYLFDLAITSESDPRLIDTVLRILPPSISGMTDISRETPGIYDIDKVPDRRLL